MYLCEEHRNWLIVGSTPTPLTNFKSIQMTQLEMQRIVQQYKMGFLTPGELVSQLKPYYNLLSPVEILNVVNTAILEHTNEIK